jgi:hypothetical protein
MGHVYAFNCVEIVRDLLRCMCPRSTVAQVFVPYCGQVSALYSGASVRSLLIGKCPLSAVGQVSAFYVWASVPAVLWDKCSRSIVGKCTRFTVGQLSAYCSGQLSAPYCTEIFRVLLCTSVCDLLWVK